MNNNQVFIEQRHATSNRDEFDNFNEILTIVQQSLSEADQRRLIQALKPRPNPTDVTPQQWMMDAYQVILHGVQIMHSDQARQWKGYRTVIENCPI